MQTKESEPHGLCSQVDVASPTLLFPAKQALGDRLVDKAPTAGSGPGLRSVFAARKGGLLRGWGLEPIRCLRPRQTFLPACISRAALWIKTDACGVRV